MVNATRQEADQQTSRQIEVTPVWGALAPSPLLIPVKSGLTANVTGKNR